MNIKLLSSVPTLLLVACLQQVAFAQASQRFPIEGEYARRAGVIRQQPSVYATPPLGDNEGPLVGNGVVIAPCRAITNFHVAFGRGKNSATKAIVFVKPRSIGHMLDFSLDLDSKTGNFQRFVKAKVIGWGNYMRTERGTLGDLALLELDPCLPSDLFPPFDFRMSTESEDVPTGQLMAVAVDLTEGKHRNVAQFCRSEDITPVDGLFITKDCMSDPGMSGSAIYEMGVNGNWHFAGLTTRRGVELEDRASSAIAISARTVEAFLKTIGAQNSQRSR